jgi:PRC-barrel domain
MNRSMSDKQACKASDVIGMNVRAKNDDDNIGEIKDLMISHDGNVEYVAVSFGGFLGLGDKLFAVPLEAIEFVKTGEDPSDSYARIDVTEKTLRDKKGFNEDNWPQKADQGFLTSGMRRQAERPTTSQHVAQ